ncbi:glycoside hydrolase family 43 protein [Sphingobacterium hungaricum]|uniref:1,4-beta-xylanase n=1 Tax=Sphingobacterium hungaricum TaxID=2082723 RepID=A0A928YRF1_9SPHI|nr:glycoside hydrolase family 43 protein [Sphingobacterium hungaricum]MBE8714090.1 1,4-beta-xylanase [Sphingobacterium hungaricum]
MKLHSMVYLIFILLLSNCGSEAGTDQPIEVKDTIKTDVFFGDPFILLHENTYYAYGTAAEDGIEVLTSTDLINWERPNTKLALSKNDVWGDKWFWAPEVYFQKGKFYMYYTAEERICVATSDSPLGPFKQEVKEPMIANEQCIDNSLFIDSDGKPYLYYDRFNDGLNIWVAELEEDLVTIKKGTEKKCIHVSQPWEEVWPRVNEGSFVIKQGNTYYMTYSANSYESQSYGIGFATADHPTGPWTKFEGNPIYQNVKNLVGVGHSAIFKDKAGNLKKVFHAHNSSTNIHPRKMYITSVSFVKEGEKEIMKIDENFISPKLLIY